MAGRWSRATVAALSVDPDAGELRRRDAELRQREQELLLRDRQMRALSARLHAVLESERSRISRHVHDELGSLLTGLKMDLRWIARRLELPTSCELAAVRARLEESERLVERVAETVQHIAVELRPSALDALGLAAALRDEARRFAARAGIAITIDVDDTVRPSAAVATALFRIFQEMMTNVARHANASSVRIVLAEDGGSWLLRVEDDGVGVDGDELAGPRSLGLLGMSERAAVLGGRFTLRRGARAGSVATVRIPTGAVEDPTRADA
jgi:two-component system sensor histidine kinase UhpB